MVTESVCGWNVSSNLYLSVTSWQWRECQAALMTLTLDSRNRAWLYVLAQSPYLIYIFHCPDSFLWIQAPWKLSTQIRWTWQWQRCVSGGLQYPVRVTHGLMTTSYPHPNCLTPDPRHTPNFEFTQDTTHPQLHRHTNTPLSYLHTNWNWCPLIDLARPIYYPVCVNYSDPAMFRVPVSHLGKCIIHWH